MSILSWGLIKMSQIMSNNNSFDKIKAMESQRNIMSQLVSVGKTTKYWIENKISEIRSYKDFKNNVPLRHYIDFQPYINRILQGELNVLWNGLPIYMVRSLENNNEKYVPITSIFLDNYINGIKLTVFNYINSTKDVKSFINKHYFLSIPSSDSPIAFKEKIPAGDILQIVDNYVPWYIRNRYITLDSNNQNLLSNKQISIIFGNIEAIDRFITNATNKDIFNELSLIINNINDPYNKDRSIKILNKNVNSLSVYLKPEGFIANQKNTNEQDFSLQLNNNIFFEFIPIQTLSDQKPQRLSIDSVELNQEYVMAISTSAGLWAYLLDDVIKFTSLVPYKIQIIDHIK